MAGSAGLWGEPPGEGGASSGSPVESLVGTITLLVVGAHYSCVLDDEGQLACWMGRPEQASQPAEGTFRDVSCYWSSCLAVRDDGTVVGVGWGATGPSLERSAPADVQFDRISLGENRACGLTTEEALRCWGDAPTESSPPPGAFVEVVSGWLHDCALTAEHSISCWGVGEDGQVGDCTGDEICGQATPPPGTFTQIDAGSLHTCGVRLDGTVACWGSNDYGQCDAPPGAFEQVVAGAGCSCGIRAGGAVECWGQGWLPEPLPEQSYVQLALDESQLCGLTKDGRVFCS